MYNIIKASQNDRRALFLNTAQKMGLHEAIVEKDFWVCLTLDYLFHRCKWKDAFLFKGGTSLSKAYGLIRRFSEDIDLVMDWRLLGYEKDEPWRPRSKTQQDLFNHEAIDRSAAFLHDQFLPALQQDLSAILGEDAHVEINDDPNVIDFHYPHIFDAGSILQAIRLEMGSLADWTPSQERAITPYVAQEYPRIFRQADTTVRTATAERTLWEKVTILHQEANRPENRPMPKRYARHYYDLYCIANSPHVETAFQDIPLLYRVIDFKMKFYPRAWARYEEAKQGRIRLMPPSYNLPVLRDDYQHIQDMIFGDRPSFDELLAFLQSFERTLQEKMTA